MRVKTMLEAEIEANTSRNIYFGQGKVGDNCVESVYIQVLEGAIADLRGSIKTDGEEIEGQAITGFKLADFTPSYEAAFFKVDSLDDSDRGQGGFGSTGK